MKKQLQLLFLMLIISIQTNAQMGEALNFDGSDDYISAPNQSLLNFGTGDFTIEADFKSSFSQPNYAGVVAKASSGANVGVQMVIVNNRLAAEFSDGSTGFGTGNGLVGTTVLTDGNWHHIAMVVKRSANQIQLLVDGLVEATFTNSAISTMNVNFPSAALLIGVERTYGIKINGNLDEVRLWNVARTQCEINTYKNCEIPTTTNGLVANYHFNQGLDAANNSGVNTLTDASGNSNTGTLTNFTLNGTTSNWIAPGGVVSGFTTAVISSFCTPAAALNFDGVNDRVNLGNGITNSLAGSTKVSVEAWVRPTSLSGLGCIIGNYNTGSADLQILLRRSFSGYYEFWIGNGGSWYNINSAASPTLNVWQHVAATWNGTELSIYVNGVLSGKTTPPISTLGNSNNNPVWLGGNTINESFTGDIDEVRIWNIERTQCDIISNMNCEIVAATPGLLANYHFNQGYDLFNNSAVTSLTDDSGNLNTGTLTNFALTGSTSNWVAPGGVTSGFTTPSSCAPAAALNFDGVNDVVSLPNGLPSMADMTIEGWIFPESISNFNVILNNSNWYTGLLHFQLRPSGELGFSINGNSPADQNTSMVFIPNQWYHVAAVYSSTNQYLKFYVNGELVDTYAYTTAISTAANAQFEIGGWDGQRFFDGTMDELRVWNTIRSECEINTFMNCEIPSSATGLVVNYHFNQGIAGFDNSFVTTMMDASGNSNNGTLNNFALNGSTSNWIAPGAVVSGYTMTTITAPTVTVNSGAICTGQSFTMTPGGALTYTYSNGSSVATPTSGATYTVMGTDANGCENMAISSVTVNALPTITVNDGTLCAGQSFTMLPNGAVTYTYSNGSDVAMPTSDATYTVTGTDANGCENMAISSVTVNALPTITVNSETICAGQSFTMMPSGAVTYTYSNGSNVAMPTSDATYTVTGTDANGCENMATSSVTVNASPSLNASTTATIICSGETATLSVTGASTYTWSTNETTSDIAVNPTSQSTYTVEGTDSNGCSGMTTITQDVSLCTGIVSNSLLNPNSLNIYPNPNNGMFTIKSDTDMQLNLTNALGQVVQVIELSSINNHEITVNGLGNGVYFITGQNANQSIKQKVIVTK